jgi:putative tryptophan/tyrosine transport system substrate-binding protein
LACFGGDANVAFAMESMQRAARELSVQLHAFDIASADDLQTAFAAMKHANVDGLIVIAGALTYAVTSQIAKLAMENELPSCHAFKEAVDDGGLVSLGPDSLIMAGQGAVYADKIITGAAPGELPVEQPARYELHVNLKTAKTLGLRVPPTLLARAEKIIE